MKKEKTKDIEIPHTVTYFDETIEAKKHYLCTLAEVIDTANNVRGNDGDLGDFIRFIARIGLGLNAEILKLEEVVKEAVETTESIIKP